MIQFAAQYAQWCDSDPSPERSHFLLGERADTSVWLQILDEYPRCQRQVSRNESLSLQVLERLRGVRDFGVQYRVLSNDLWRQTHPDDVDPSELNPEEHVEYELTTVERSVLRQGLLQWGGPAYCSEELSIAMGFISVANLLDDGERIGASIGSCQPLSHIDWTRALLATEFDFISDTIGAGHDWSIASGFSDEETLKTIRELQIHLVAGGSALRNFGTMPKRS